RPTRIEGHLAGPRPGHAGAAARRRVTPRHSARGSAGTAVALGVGRRNDVSRRRTHFEMPMSLTLVTLIATAGCDMPLEEEVDEDDSIAESQSAIQIGDPPPEDDPTDTQLSLWSISTTPSSLAQPGTVNLSFKVVLDGKLTAVCNGTLSVSN